MRAASAAGREVFGYNRSVEGVQAATADGFDATEKIDKALKRAAKARALIVVAVPVPALPIVLQHVRDLAPDCPLTDVTSVKAAVLDEVKSSGLLANFVGGHPMAGTAHSGWAAGDPELFVGAPWVVSVDDHVDPDVWAMVMELALDCRAIVVPAKSDEHDAAAAAISLPKPWPPPQARCRLPSRWPPAPSATARGWRQRHRLWFVPCAKRIQNSCCPPSTAPSRC